MNLKDEVSKTSPPAGGEVWRGKLEVIGFTIEGCMIAQSAGANRIELCDNPADGGTTASYGFIKSARKKLQIELYPIIRPGGGDFLYSNDEFEIMKTDVKACKDIGCDGVVIGMLTQNGKVDKKRCGLLVDYAYPLGVTFHRAFDRTIDPFEALEDIIEIGCERILTSGQKANALDGKEMIAELVKVADDRIIIMPGAGIKSDNIIEIAETTGAVEFHTSARIQLDNKISIDENEVKKIIKKLASL